MMKQSFLEAYKRTNSLDADAMFFEDRHNDTANNQRRMEILNQILQKKKDNLESSNIALPTQSVQTTT